MAHCPVRAKPPVTAGRGGDDGVSGPRGVVRGHVVVAVEVLRSRMAESWSLDALADEVHLSRSQLVRSFDATVKMSPMAYLRRMRVERMARLLVSTDVSIAEAARLVGWRNQFHASQCWLSRTRSSVTVGRGGSICSSSSGSGTPADSRS
jgi:transcriptional regulator GlxA family with amidase domain